MYILFTDIDGTLLPDNRILSDDLRKEIHQFINAGNVFVLCSGRPEYSLIKLKEELDLPDHNVFISSFNGSRLYDVENKKLVYQEGISIDLTRKILNFSYELGLHCHTYNDHAVISEKNTPEVLRYSEHVMVPIELTDDFSKNVTAQVPKILAIADTDTDRFKELQEYINKISNHTLTSLCSYSTFFEIFSKKAGKGTAVKNLAAYLSTSIEQTIAVGDAPNDISMLEIANYSYAMKNANDETKSKAKFVTQKTNNENGLIEVLKKYR
jgi:Cof subfamily protein (haloacid dehalogenase superfamily)